MSTASLDGFSAVSVDQVAPIEVGPGCSRRDLPGPVGLRVWMVDMAPGSQWPHADRHGPGGEVYLVVAGEVIEDDRRLGPGAYVCFAPHSRHRPRSEAGARLFGFNPAPPALDGRTPSAEPQEPAL